MFKHHLKDHHCAWPLHWSGTADPFSASTELAATEPNISLETALWLQRKKYLSTLWNSVGSIQKARCSSRDFSIIKTHIIAKTVSMQCIACENTGCAFLEKAVTSNDNTAGKGLGIANYYQWHKKPNWNRMGDTQIFMLLFYLPGLLSCVDVEEGMSLMLLMFVRRIRHTLFGTHMISPLHFFSPLPSSSGCCGLSACSWRNGTQTKQMLLQGRLLGCWCSCTNSYFYTKCASWQHWHTQVFWWRTRKHLFCFKALPSDNFATAFTVSLEQWTFWSSFKAIGSTLLFHCCNYDILYNIFTAFQDKELHFFSEFVIAFIGKVPQHYLISQLLRFSQSFSALLCIKNNKKKKKAREKTVFRAHSDIGSQSSRQISDISLQKGRVTMFLWAYQERYESQLVTALLCKPDFDECTACVLVGRFFCDYDKLQGQGKMQQNLVRKGACVFHCISFGDTFSCCLLII